eukprot:scaffold235963_cov20-Tisochrysis_lutea.AAC.1
MFRSTAWHTILCITECIHPTTKQNAGPFPSTPGLKGELPKEACLKHSPATVTLVAVDRAAHYQRGPIKHNRLCIDDT